MAWVVENQLHAKCLKSWGIPVFYSDLAAKKIMDSNKEIISKVEKEFPGVYKDSVLNRKKLANIVFNDKDKLEVLNNIVHPAVR